MRFVLKRLTARINEVRNYIPRRVIPMPNWRIIPEVEYTKQVPATDDPRWQPFTIGQWWGADDKQTWAWFACTLQVPQEMQGSQTALRLRLGELNRSEYPEALAYVNGRERQGIDRWHELLTFDEGTCAQSTIQVALEAWRGRNYAAERFWQAELIQIDAETKGFYYDALVALEVAKTLPEADYTRIRLLNVLEKAFQVLDLREPIGDAFYESVGEARRTLAESLVAEKLAPNHEKVRAIGHAHIDVAWLWSLAQTRQKTARTFSTALRLMEHFPTYHFISSQAQLYQYIQQDYPDLLTQIQRRVREGRWEVNGGTWVEMDTNVTGGESLVRQFLYGRRLFRELFGQDGDILWLPDVFGYSGALPQLIVQAGLRYFMTTKISWSQYNRFPYDTFYWQGIDGTQVLTHFATTPSNNWFYTYNGYLRPQEVQGTWAANTGKEFTDEVLMSYGFGDGGGGPTSDMLEQGVRLANHPAAPQVVLGTANSFFHELEAKVQGQRVPVWNGELYLEYHRGTLTSQAQNKRANRKSEVLYHQAEALASAASLLGAAYPAEALHKGWELILVNQFHDILPGSSIHAVYEDCARDYAKIAQIGAEARGNAAQTIARRVAGAANAESVVVFNTLGWGISELIEVQAPRELQQPALVDAANGATLAMQQVGEGRYLALVSSVPSYGYKLLRWQASSVAPTPAGLSASTDCIETPFLKVQLGADGMFTSCYDKRAGREVLAEGQRANLLQAFEDKPLGNDAWDIDIFYLDKSWELNSLESARVVEAGPLRCCLELVRSWRSSRIVQRIYAYQHTARIDFCTEADWHEHHILLKTAFPVAVHATQATYEIQFGAIERPTHWNTSWDYARFEVCGHRWSDLSEGDYGVSLLNDCKYGHDTKDNVLRLTLIKSATSPDPDADQGKHVFTYALLPHQGDWRCGTVQEAALLNNPPVAIGVPAGCGTPGAALPPTKSLAACSAEHVIIDTIKAAEDGDGFIVRLYEAYNQRGKVRLTFARPLKAAWECNLLEENGAALPCEGDALDLTVMPYQVRSLRIRF
ncbi:MAG: alpha-mannosidase [Chloroflexi bacterium]|nr:alpha-mannosidase [Chloroflexota bacterium]